MTRTKQSTRRYLPQPQSSSNEIENLSKATTNPSNERLEDRELWENARLESWIRPTQGVKTMRLLYLCSSVSSEHRHVPNVEDQNTYCLTDQDADTAETPSSQGDEDTPKAPPPSPLSSPPPPETEVPSKSRRFKKRARKNVPTRLIPHR
jgi:hypothetical protein